MKIFNAKLTKGGRDYKASIAVCESMPVSQLLVLLNVSLPIAQATVIGFKDSQGVLLVPSLICSNPDLLRPDDYEVIIKQTNAPSQSTPRLNIEQKLLSLVSQMCLQRLLPTSQFYSIVELIRQQQPSLIQAYQKFFSNSDLEGFKEWLAQKSGRHVPENSENRQKVSRPSTSRPQVYRGQSQNRIQRPWTSQSNSRSHSRVIQVVFQLENYGRLDQRDLGAINSLILREQPDVMRQIENYIIRQIDLGELCRRLQELATDLVSFAQRPSSPIPRKNELQMLVNTLLKENIPSQEDMEVLNSLIAEQNEFVFSAFGVFESDRDTKELVDSLSRAIAKYKRIMRPVTPVGNQEEAKGVMGFVASQEEPIDIINSSYEEERDDFIEFIKENFEMGQQEVILKMFEGEDQRLKAALDVLDIHQDKEQLIETISFLLKSQLRFVMKLEG